MPIETWFPTIIFYEDVVIPTRTHELALSAVREMTGADPPPGTRRTAAELPNTLHLDPRLDPLLQELGPPIRRFLYDALRFDPALTQFYVGRCWPVLQTAGAGGEPHVHGGAFVSGVFYLETPEGSGGIEFTKPHRSNFDHMHKREHSPLTYSMTVYAAVKHRLILFGSDLRHRALESAEDAAGPRIAVAFDLYSLSDVKSPYGGMPHLHNLKEIP